VWHLEVALPELQAAADGATHADALVAAAATHVRSAISDMSHPALRDAALGTQLTDLAAHLDARPADLAPAIRIIRGARAQAQLGVDALIPRLDSPQELLSLAPAGAAPRAELALIDSPAAARRFKATSDVQRAVVKRILAEGTIDPNPVRWVGGYGNGNGAMPMVRVSHPDSPHLSVLAVHRAPTQQAAQEEFFARLAELSGTDQHYAPAVRRADGSALVYAVPGHNLWDDVHSGDDIAGVMGTWYGQRFPALGEDGARLAGRLDFDEAKSLDYLTAQPDRNAGSPLGDAAAGEFRFIDNGLAGRGETANVLKPGMKSHFVGGTPGHATVHPQAAANVTGRLTDEALDDAHRLLREGPAGDLPSGHMGALRQDASLGYLEAMRARRDQLATGSFEYEPIDLNANPLAHMDWLHAHLGPRSY
jgi:hypothetical protein